MRSTCTPQPAALTPPNTQAIPHRRPMTRDHEDVMKFLRIAISFLFLHMDHSYLLRGAFRGYATFLQKVAYVENGLGSIGRATFDLRAAFPANRRQPESRTALAGLVAVLHQIPTTG